MRVVVQRVLSARVEVEGRVVGAIGEGLLILAGFEDRDTPNHLAWMAGKIARLRIFPDAAGAMNRSLLDCRGDALVVSQFTLFASTKKGNRPSWSRAARPELAQSLFESFVGILNADLRRPVATGVFAADMKVHLINDGPVTLCIDSHCPE